MMKRFLFTLLFCGLASSAFAQLGEVSLSFGKARTTNNSLGSSVGDPAVQDTKLDTGFRFGFRFTINNWRHFGHEIGYAYTRTTVNTASLGKFGMPMHQGFYDFLAYATPEGFRIRPFAAGGVQFSSFIPPGASVFNGNGVTKFGLNYGGGIKAKVSSLFLVRADIRDYLNAKPDFGFPGEKGWLHILEVSAGLGFTF
jgi:opacity protein-like surface antigen